MSFRLAACILSAALLASCASTKPVPSTVGAGSPGEASTAPLDTTPDPIALRFDWPAGWNVPVTDEHVRWQEAMGRRRTSTATVRWRMTTEAVEGAIALQSHDHAIETDNERMATTLRQGYHAVEGSWTEVSAEGEFLRVGGLERYEERMAQFLEELNLSPEDAGPMANAFSLEFLAAKAEDDWNLFIGFWLDAELEVGDVLEYRGDGQNRVTGEPMGMVIRWAFAGWTPCTPSEEELRCVRLETVTTPDAETINAFVMQMLEQMVGPQLERHGIDVSFGSYETQVVLVAEPDGLIPHRFERRRITTAHMVMDGQEMTVEAGDTLTRTYHHP